MKVGTLDHRSGEMPSLEFYEVGSDWTPERRVRFGLRLLGLVSLEEVMEIIGDDLTVNRLNQFVGDELEGNIALAERLGQADYDVMGLREHVAAVGAGLVRLFGQCAQETDVVYWTIPFDLPHHDALTDPRSRQGRIYWNVVSHH